MKETADSTKQDRIQIDLEGCLIQMDASRSWFERRALPLSLDQLRWRPGPSGWSIAECLDHLNLTIALYQPKIEEAIGRLRAGNRASFLDPIENEALRWVEPPPVIRLSSPLSIAPAAAVDPDTLVDGFHRLRARYADAVRRASGLDLTVPIAEPIHPIIRSLGGVLALIAAHDRRHLWQAEQVRNSPGFPRSVVKEGENSK